MISSNRLAWAGKNFFVGILMFELASAQKTEIHVFQRDLIDAIRHSRSILKEFVGSVRKKIEERVDDGVRAIFISNELFELYFADGNTYETYLMYWSNTDCPKTISTI